MTSIKASLSDLLTLDDMSKLEIYNRVHQLNFASRRRIGNHSKMAARINERLDEFFSELEPYRWWAQQASMTENWKVLEQAMLKELKKPNKDMENICIGDGCPMDIRGILDETYSTVYAKMLHGMTGLLSIPHHLEPPSPSASDLEWLGYTEHLRKSVETSSELKCVLTALDLSERLAHNAGQIAQRYVNYALVGIHPNPYEPLMDLLELGVFPDWSYEMIPFYYDGSRMVAHMFTESKRGPKIMKMKHGENRFLSDTVQYPDMPVIQFQ